MDLLKILLQDKKAIRQKNEKRRVRRRIKKKLREALFKNSFSFLWTLKSMMISSVLFLWEKRSQSVDWSGMRIGGRLNKLPHDRENYLPVYFRDSSPARTKVIQVIGAHCLYTIMWERPAEFCILPVKTEPVVVSCHLWVCVPGRKDGR